MGRASHERHDPSLVALRPSGDRLHLYFNHTVLSTGLDGWIRDGEHGLFVHEARVLSDYRVFIGRKEPRPVGVSAIDARRSHGYHVCFPPDRRPGPADEGSGLLIEDTQQTVELVVRRGIVRSEDARFDVVEEELELTNYSSDRTAFDLTLKIDCDFRSLPEIRSGPLGLGHVRRCWNAATLTLRFHWQARNTFDHGSEAGEATDERALTVTVTAADGPVRDVADGLAFPVTLRPGERWTARIQLTPFVRGAAAIPGPRRIDRPFTTRFEFPYDTSRVPRVSDVLERAQRDLVDLRLEDLDGGRHAWTMAAGIPLYVALFGRDVLTASWQAAVLTPDMMRGSLLALARLQGREHNDWRDEAPGRFLHEAHTGPLETLNVYPRARYYGSVTTSGFFPLVLAEFWHWTADEECVRELLPNALDGLRWLDREADLDGDGFFEYQTRSSLGTKHQAWKDSADAIVYPDGTVAEPPIATSEEQAFVYVAKAHLAATLWRLGEWREARRLLREARQLKKRFNAAFWLPDQRFFAMGLDAEKRPIASAGSNAGHCLAAGIIRREHVRPTVERLFRDDLFSGWGIRTLSSEHPAYNPYSYHRGSVWPAEQGSFALGLMRYGLHAELERLARAVFDATALFEHSRLPELFAGHQRDERHPFPGLYPQANAPQAWSASTLFLIMQSLLGLYPYAPSKLLFIDPHLPEWLPDVTLRDLRVGDADVTIQFHRAANGHTEYRVRHKQGTLHVVRQASPWSLTERIRHRVRDLVRRS
jgi:glycogen debranching enzyme